jgi:DNA-binding MarR family transcriptional regulator
MAADRQTSRPPTLELEALPGHYIRRLQQIAVAVFLQETSDHGITPVQYAAMQRIAHSPGIDQRTLARAIGFDTSTIAGVIDRLEARGWVARSVSAEDRRARALAITPAGQTLLEEVVPGVLAAQDRMLEPLSRDEREVFVRMLKTVVTANNTLSRAPSGGEG